MKDKLKEKELLFFSSEQKNELLDIWYINKSFISTGKESIKKQNKRRKKRRT